jgi:hypothetical protein
VAGGSVVATLPFKANSFSRVLKEVLKIWKNT